MLCVILSHPNLRRCKVEEMESGRDNEVATGLLGNSPSERKDDQDLEHHGPRGPEVTALKVKVMSWLCTLVVGFPISRSHNALFSAAGSARVAWRDPFH